MPELRSELASDYTTFKNKTRNYTCNYYDKLEALGVILHRP